eukprot:2928342-Rhodomonas_salina.1
MKALEFVHRVSCQRCESAVLETTQSFLLFEAGNPFRASQFVNEFTEAREPAKEFVHAAEAASHVSVVNGRGWKKHLRCVAERKRHSASPWGVCACVCVVWSAKRSAVASAVCVVASVVCVAGRIVCVSSEVVFKYTECILLRFKPAHATHVLTCWCCQGLVVGRVCVAWRWFLFGSFGIFQQRELHFELLKLTLARVDAVGDGCRGAFGDCGGSGGYLVDVGDGDDAFTGEGALFDWAVYHCEVAFVSPVDEDVRFEADEWAVCGVGARHIGVCDASACDVCGVCRG